MLLCSGGVPSRGNHLAQHRLHRQCGLHPPHKQEAHWPALLAGWGEQVRTDGSLGFIHSWLICFQFVWSCQYIFFSYSSLFPLIIPLCLHLSFPHATDGTLLAKFKQQHQGNKYFVPTPVMEPAFVIQHFAGKVKYHVKVRMVIRGDAESQINLD